MDKVQGEGKHGEQELNGGLSQPCYGDITTTAIEETRGKGLVVRSETRSYMYMQKKHVENMVR